MAIVAATDAALATRNDRQVRLLTRWVARCTLPIQEKVFDAHAHLTKAVTDTLRKLPDGRATLRRATLSPSADAAANRLRELWDTLCGRSRSSLDGLIRDAREEFYRHAFETWKPFLPVHLWVASDPQPTLANVRIMRGLVIHGVELRQEVGVPVLRSIGGIVPTLTRAGKRGTSDRESAYLLKTWSEQASGRIIDAVQTAISDSLVAADTLAGRDLVHPDHRDDTPLEA